MILLVDNYDSFSYNLVQLIGEINPDVKVIRNDEKTVEEIREKTNIPALKRTEAIRRAADWVIEHSTIEEK